MGKPGRPKKDGAATNAVTTKLTDDELRALEARVESQNARLAAEGIGATVTLSGLVRTLIVQGLGMAHAPVASKRVEREPVVPPEAPESEADVAPDDAGSDERHVRPPMHNRRIKARPEPVEAPVEGKNGSTVENGHTPEGESSDGPPDDDELAAILEGTPL